MFAIYLPKHSIAILELGVNAKCFFLIHLHCLNLRRHFALKRESVLCTLRTVSQIILLMNNCYQWRKQRWGYCDCFEKKGPCKNANKSTKFENLVVKYFIREWDENKLLQNTGLDLIKYCFLHERQSQL